MPKGGASSLTPVHAGLQEDLDSFLKAFLKLKTVRFAEYKSLFESRGMIQLYSGRHSSAEIIEFNETILVHCLQYLEEFVCPGTPRTLEERLFGLYSLYTFFYIQEMNHVVKIRMDPDAARTFRRFSSFLQAEEILDAYMCCLKLEEDKAIKFVAFIPIFDPSCFKRFDTDNKVTGVSILANVNDPLSAVRFLLKTPMFNALSVVHREYCRMKKAARVKIEGPRLLDARETAEEIVKASADHAEKRSGVEEVLNAESAEQLGSFRARRSEIKERAYGADLNLARFRRHRTTTPLAVETDTFEFTKEPVDVPDAPRRKPNAKKRGRKPKNWVQEPPKRGRPRRKCVVYQEKEPEPTEKEQEEELVEQEQEPEPEPEKEEKKLQAHPDLGKKKKKAKRLMILKPEEPKKSIMKVSKSFEKIEKAEESENSRVLKVFEPEKMDSEDVEPNEPEEQEESIEMQSNVLKSERSSSEAQLEKPIRGRLRRKCGMYESMPETRVSSEKKTSKRRVDELDDVIVELPKQKKREILNSKDDQKASEEPNEVDLTLLQKTSEGIQDLTEEIRDDRKNQNPKKPFRDGRVQRSPERMSNETGVQNQKRTEDSNKISSSERRIQPNIVQKSYEIADVQNRPLNSSEIHQNQKTGSGSDAQNLLEKDEVDVVFQTMLLKTYREDEIQNLLQKTSNEKEILETREIEDHQISIQKTSGNDGIEMSLREAQFQPNPVEMPFHGSQKTSTKEDVQNPVEKNDEDVLFQIMLRKTYKDDEVQDLFQKTSEEIANPNSIQKTSGESDTLRSLQNTSRSPHNHHLKALSKDSEDVEEEVLSLETSPVEREGVSSDEGTLEMDEGDVETAPPIPKPIIKSTKSNRRSTPKRRVSFREKKNGDVETTIHEISPRRYKRQRVEILEMSEADEHFLEYQRAVVEIEDPSSGGESAVKLNHDERDGPSGSESAKKTDEVVPMTIDFCPLENEEELLAATEDPFEFDDSDSEVSLDVCD